jgi:hypothetical protein
VVVAIVSVTLSGCATYAPPSPRVVADSATQRHWSALRFTTTDGTIHELARVRVARDTLFGIPAPAGGPEVGFALLDIQHSDTIHPVPPRDHVERFAGGLWFMPLVMTYENVSRVAARVG